LERENWIASSQVLLAMTIFGHAYKSHGAMRDPIGRKTLPRPPHPIPRP
jgi:hypothetical protein